MSNQISLTQQSNIYPNSAYRRLNCTPVEPPKCSASCAAMMSEIQNAAPTIVRRNYVHIPTMTLKINNQIRKHDLEFIFDHNLRKFKRQNPAKTNEMLRTIAARRHGGSTFTPKNLQKRGKNELRSCEGGGNDAAAFTNTNTRHPCIYVLVFT